MSNYEILEQSVSELAIRLIDITKSDSEITVWVDMVSSYLQVNFLLGFITFSQISDLRDVFIDTFNDNY